MSDFQATAKDGFRLSGTEHGLAGQAQAVVVLAPAMGTEQRYYSAFAAWLGQQGFLALTFDYRGTGRSRTEPLRGFAADLTTWATVDSAAVVDHAARLAGDRPILWVGHSLGGQIFGMLPNRDRLRALLTVACGTGYWRENVPSLRWKAWCLWYLIVPPALGLFRYFPGKRIGVIGDIPLGAMAQWRRWCLNPDYMVGAEGLRQQYAEVRQPVCGLAFTDDEMMSWRNIEHLHGFYSGAPCEVRRIQPSDINAPRIGHFGFFRSQFESTLWVQAADWLKTQAKG